MDMTKYSSFMGEYVKYVSVRGIAIDHGGSLHEFRQVVIVRVNPLGLDGSLE